MAPIGGRLGRLSHSRKCKEHDTVTPLAVLSPPERGEGVPAGSEEVWQEAALSLKGISQLSAWLLERWLYAS